MTFRRLGWPLFLSSFAAASVLPSLPLDAPETTLLDRLDGTGGCRLPPRRPWPGEAVVACIDSLLASPSTHPDDKARLALFRSRLALRDPGSETGRWMWSENSDRIAFDIGATGYAHAIDRKVAIGAKLNDSLNRDDLVGLRVRPRVDVLLGDDLVMWSRPRQLVELSDQHRWLKTSDPQHGIYQTALFGKAGEMGRARTNDWIEGAVEFQTRLGRFTAGLTPLEWGDLPIEPLMLSGNTESIPLVEVTQSIGPIEATLLAGRLMGDTWEERRYLYAHRFAWNHPNWTLGWSEMVLSIDRDLEPLYLVPVFPFLFTEHYLGDPDNKQMDFDLSWRPVPGLEASSELFLDDLQNYLGFFSNGWGNKWALALGLKASGWTGAGSLDKFQAQRVEPWTQTASSSIIPEAPSNLPVHFGKPLGNSRGPNSASLAWVHRQDLSKNWSWNGGLSALWKGITPGSSIYDRNWRDSSGTWVVAYPTKQWLSGDLIDAQEVSGGVEWRFQAGWRWAATGTFTRQSAPGSSVGFHPGFSTEVSYHE